MIVPTEVPGVGIVDLPHDVMFAAVSRQLVERCIDEQGDGWSRPVQVRMAVVDGLVEPMFRHFSPEIEETIKELTGD